MSMPQFPEIPGLTLEDSIIQIISSIAMEELALSHIINAEGEKLQYVLGTLSSGSTPCTPPTLNELLEVNDSVKDMLSTISMNQMFLLGKMSAAMSAYAKLKKATKDDDNGGGGGGGGTDPEGLQVIDGEILDGDAVGDSSNWIQIATYEGYSLIIRQNFINIYSNGHQGEPAWQHSWFGPNNQYKDSSVRTRINDWFTGNAVGTADNLASDAPLRDYTVKNTALNAIGTGTLVESINDGFSKPVAEPDRTGLDVAFALSYGEAANYISMSYAWGGGQSAASPELAQINFGKIVIPATGSYRSLWLRSPAGIINGKQLASTLENFNGRVFRYYIEDRALIYPALWVDTEIFDLNPKSRIPDGANSQNRSDTNPQNKLCMGGFGDI